MVEKHLEKIVGTPADVLDKTVNLSQDIVKQTKVEVSVKKARKFWRSLGPGLTTGASDDDPSGVGTYSQAGAVYGFQLLWLAGFTFPFMAIVQEMCARIGLVTGRGLAGNIRIHFPKWVLYITTILLVVANTFNIGADLGAMAKGAQLLFPNVSFVTLVLGFAIVSVGLQIYVPYEKYAKYLKWLALILLVYIFAAFSVHLDFLKLLKGAVIPSITFSRDQLFLIVGILGTTISPYLFFWQTSQEVEEEILKGETTVAMRQEMTSNKDIKSMRVDIWSGMFLSNVVMFFIIAACAATLYSAGIKNINSAADAAAALKPLAGNYAFLLFASGIIGTGLLAIPVLAGSASYAMAESFGWKTGLYRKLKEANSFYGLIIISTFVGVGLNFVGLDPIKALIFAAVANGLVAPVILVLIVLLSSNKKVMGDKVNHPVITLLAWVITIMMTVAGVATILLSIF